jgi:hypothetical protein
MIKHTKKAKKTQQKTLCPTPPDETKKPQGVDEPQRGKIKPASPVSSQTKTLKLGRLERSRALRKSGVYPTNSKQKTKTPSLLGRLSDHERCEVGVYPARRTI